MPKFSAHIGFLFTERDFYARFEAAAKAGFGAVEHPAPHTFDIARISDLLQEHNLAVTQVGMPAGDVAKGEKGLACLPDRKEEFLEGLAIGIANAHALGCPRLHMMAGIVPEGVSREQLYDTYLENLQCAARACTEAAIKLIIEPISDYANPGYFLNLPNFAVQAIHDARVGNVYLLYDLYHAQVSQGNLTPFLEQHLPIIEHIHIADHPGRHEPGTGEINYSFLFTTLDRLEYRHWVGCEYIPSRTTEHSLKWIRAETYHIVATEQK